MNKSNDLAARAALVRKPRTSEPKVEEAKAPPKKAPVRTKPISLSVEVSQQAYHRLAGYCGQIAIKLGRPRVAHVAVFRALLDELDENEELQQLVESRIAGTGP